MNIELIVRLFCFFLHKIPPPLVFSKLACSSSPTVTVSLPFCWSHTGKVTFSLFVFFEIGLYYVALAVLVLFV